MYNFDYHIPMNAIAYHYAESSRMELVLSHAARHYPWHIHAEHWTVGLVLAGSVTLGTKDAKRVLHRGEYFIVAPREAHWLEVAPQSSLAVLCIDTARLESTADDFSRLASCATVLDTRDIVQLERLLPLTHSAPSSGDSSHFRSVIRRLIAAPEEAFSVPEMADLTGYSHWHFLRRFRAETGLTPHAFQLACRLRRARLLLRKNTAAADTAAAAGFADQSHMHKIFKLHHGLTPRQFLAASFRS
ncbi:MAG: AraC family transcriptional regulator [Burkholderiales bacterium]|jgi:AraC-like DNA-binding protein/quercetin dioxygenase-like cupin family protein|nr:AraC family transcriptional regulator [Burkholderiales bacterium]